MSKRAFGKFPRRKQDAYDSPPAVVQPLLLHLQRTDLVFAEPCAGCGQLADALAAEGLTCGALFDIKPRRDDVMRRAAETITARELSGCDVIITNPPWSRDILHPMILRFSVLMPTWLLFDADWAHTVQARPYLDLCTDIVSVGRVSWMANGKNGFDNCAWYRFDAASGRDSVAPLFHGRAA